ncbi:MAG: molybdate ABC transporter substrate-binding protein [Myxococcota bacterium]|jgi:molybdate transport system substrate-binding protein|nr:molybdate ABC transporter substrate-binding protein [Myxococcota bacterium]
MSAWGFSRLCAIVLALLVAVFCGCSPNPRSIEVFVGSATKPAIEEAALVFEKQEGVKVFLHFGGSGKMLSEIKLARRGDLYLPGSSDFMELAKREKLVHPESEQRLAYLVPAINVPSGNPLNIRSLEDLARPGLKIGIARPDSVCVGLYAAEVLERAGLAQRVRSNIVTHAESCEKTAQLVALGTVDAVIGWEVFHFWQPEKIDTVLLRPEQIARIGYIPVAVTVFSAKRALAEQFIGFLVGEKGQGIFAKWHYLTSVEAARRLSRADAPVGGEWTLPKGW